MNRFIYIKSRNLWLNSNYIVRMERLENETKIDLNGQVFYISETPEEIRALIALNV